MSQVTIDKYCSVCGNGLVGSAVICPACGSQVGSAASIIANGDRSKAAAVILAVFLGPWTWVYTWKADFWKFWVYCALSMIPFSIAIASMIQMNWLPVFISIFVVLGMNLWPMLDSFVKPRTFYDSYSTVSEALLEQRAFRSNANRGSIMLVVGVVVGSLGFLNLLVGMFIPLHLHEILIAVSWVLVGATFVLFGLKRRDRVKYK